MKQIKRPGLMWCVALVVLSNLSASAQLDLSTLGTNYTQNFDSIGAGLPAEWSVQTGNTATNLGGAQTLVMAATSWATATGNFRNCASTVANSGTNYNGGESSSPVQSGTTNRAPAIRQTGSFGDPGAAFVLQLKNTLGFINFKMTMDFLLLASNGFSTTWTVDYGIGIDGGNPTNFTKLATFADPGAFGATHTNLSFETALDNQSQGVWIRVVALSAATGSGSRDTFGIDNFSLSWTNGTTSITNPPGIVSQSGNAVAVVGTSPALTATPSGTPPFAYQWFKNSSPLTDGGDVSGSTSNVLSFVGVVHTNAGTYYLAITNAAGFTNSAPISLVVTGFVIVGIPNTNTLSGTPVAGIPVLFTDPVPGISSASGASDNQALLPNASITVTGSNTNRTMTVSPVAGKSGVAVTSVTASDGSFSTNVSFALLVVPDTTVLFNDYFDYPDGSLDARSAFLWRYHSGNAGETQVTNHQLAISQSLGEDVNALFTHPLITNTAAVVYSKFTVNFSALPNAAGTYFAHFKDDSTTRFRALVWASTAGAATNKFRLGIGNGTSSTATTAQFPLDLDSNTTYTVVTKFDLDDATSTFWLNPTNESDLNVIAGDGVTGPLNIYSYAFRQNSGEGKLLVDDLVVGTSFAAVTGGSAAPGVLLSVQQSGGKAILSWPNTNYNLQSATVVSGAYDTINGATSPFTNALTNAQQYFRLITNPAPAQPAILDQSALILIQQQLHKNDPAWPQFAIPQE